MCYFSSCSFQFLSVSILSLEGRYLVFLLILWGISGFGLFTLKPEFTSAMDLTSFLGSFIFSFTLIANFFFLNWYYYPYNSSFFNFTYSFSFSIGFNTLSINFYPLLYFIPMLLGEFYSFSPPCVFWRFAVILFCYGEWIMIYHFYLLYRSTTLKNSLAGKRRCGCMPGNRERPLLCFNFLGLFLIIF